MSDWGDWIQTLVSGAAGGGITLLAQHLKGRQDAERAREGRRAAREESKSDRREEFELLRLEEARAATPALVDAALAVRNWRLENGLHVLPPMPTRDLFFAALRPLDSVCEVLLDKTVRGRLSAMLKEATDCALGEGTETRLFTAVRHFEEAAGARVRSLYGEEGSEP